MTRIFLEVHDNAGDGAYCSIDTALEDSELQLALGEFYDQLEADFSDWKADQTDDGLCIAVFGLAPSLSTKTLVQFKKVIMHLTHGETA